MCGVGGQWWSSRVEKAIPYPSSGLEAQFRVSAKLLALFQDDVDGVDNAWYIAEEREEQVYPEVNAYADLEKDSEWWKDDSEQYS